MNYTNFPYGQIPNTPLRIVQAQSLFEPSVQIPLIQLKNNNNKKNKNLNKKQNGKNEEEEEEIDSSESNKNQMKAPQGKKNIIENTPQLINSFCYVNDNTINQKNLKSNENSVNNNEEYSNNNIINMLSNNIKNNSRPKSKSKKNVTYFNKNTLAILENFDLTNEEKLLYILDNFKNIKIDPLIIKVLEDRKNNKKIIYENKNVNIYNDGQNYNEKDKNIFSLKKKINGDQNSLQSSINENNNYTAPQPVMKPVFPIDDKILFKNLEIYKISKDILDRPCPTKIDIEYNILNKLFIIWDFLITFKDIIFVEKVYDFEINKNILVFYNDLLGKENNYQYYKSVFISLLLLCIKNIPNVLPNLKDPKLFLLKSILDNLHSLSFNIILDSPMVVLKEITNCFLYNNSIEENNLKIIQSVVQDVNSAKNKEKFENNKIIFENEEYEDNIQKLDNNTKIYLLNIIIGLCFETILVKDKIRSEYENMNSLSFTKKGLDESLFDTEKRMKELNRMENFKTLSTDIENLEKKLKELKGEGDKMEMEEEKVENNNDLKNDQNNKNNENLEEMEKENNMNMNIEDDKNKKKEIKELETQIDRYKSILIENEKLIERKKDINVKIAEIIEKIYNLKTLRKKYLGIDYQSNEYYYFISVPTKIYTKNKKKEEWGYFENKEDIQKLINKLTDKGKNEKKLKVILKFILSQMKEKEEKEKKEIKEKFIEIEEQSKEEEKEKEKNDANDNINIDDEDIKLINGNENKDAENSNGIQIKIEKISLAKQQNNENNSNEDENNKKTEVCNINLGVNTRKKNNINNKTNKQKEKIEMDKIHIIEDDEDEEIEEDDVQSDLEENKIIEEKEIFTLNKNKLNNNPKKENEENKTPINPPKKELFTFVISEDRLQLNIILMKIDDVFSEYLVQFNKQWESERNRQMWKSIITKNATDKNILNTLKMFNHKFKNPYKILSAEEEQELLLKDKSNKIANNFVFDDENGNNFSIPETNNLLMLSPKVKIWSKEMDLIDIDNYYNNYLLLNVFSREQLCYVVHFYEMAIFGLVHRREGKRKL